MYIHTADNIAASEAAEASPAAQAAAAVAAAAAHSRLPIGPYRIGAARNRRASSSSASSALHRPRNAVTHPRHTRSRLDSSQQKMPALEAAALAAAAAKRDLRSNKCAR